MCISDQSFHLQALTATTTTRANLRIPEARKQTNLCALLKLWALFYTFCVRKKEEPNLRASNPFLCLSLSQVAASKHSQYHFRILLPASFCMCLGARARARPTRTSFGDPFDPMLTDPKQVSPDFTCCTRSDPQARALY